MKKIGLFLLGSFIITSCSQYVSNGEKQYQQSRNGPSVVVPSPLTDANISHFYDLPQQTEKAQISAVPPA